ncbi:hypothetical protein PoB_001582500 [Plakobranchus ocellatus]|uniref:Uncharacterized protein n=1 Tax=Plakobranchus ocellatus TaxID=259542 RepID=A0AAV3Z3X6_9GAST|nr:hypothetical protein PoB_001582500 [Plakobranchus ocellatus]
MRHGVGWCGAVWRGVVRREYVTMSAGGSAYLVRDNDTDVRGGSTWLRERPRQERASVAGLELASEGPCRSQGGFAIHCATIALHRCQKINACSKPG